MAVLLLVLLRRSPSSKWESHISSKKICFAGHGIIAFSSNYELYADMSNRVMTTLEELSPRCEIYSIDEAFCDLTGVRNCRDLTDFGREIRETVRAGRTSRSASA